MKPLIVILLCIGAVFSAGAQCENGRFQQKIFTSVKTTKNITYHRAKNAGGYVQNVLMDVFEPQNDTMVLRPLVIFQHGGAYWTGTKDYESQIVMGNELAKCGYVVSSATYRLEPGFVSLIFEDLMLKAVGRGVQDTKELVRYFYNSARDSSNPFRIDTTRIFLCGASAGAFNVMHTVYMDESDMLSDRWRGWLDEIGGVFGDYDFIDFGKDIFGVVNINGALGDKSYLDNETTSFLSVHNIWDPEVPFNRGRPYNIPTLMYVDGSNILHTKAQQLGIYNPFYIIPDAGHTSYSLDFFGNVVQPFFDSTLWYMKNYFVHQLGCNSVPTAIRPQQQLKPLDVYPNPAWDEFYLQGVQTFIGQQLTIEDLTGRLIYQGRFSGEPVSTRSLGMTKGCYIVRLTDEKNGTAAVEKLLLQ